MSKTKKIISLVVLFIFILIGFSYWKDQQEIKELNKDLPEGIRITKGIISNFKIINEIDNFTFEVPRKWKNIEEIKYMPQRESKGYTFSSVNVKGEAPQGKVIAVVKFKNKPDVSLLNQASSFFEAFELNGSLSEEKLNGKEIVSGEKINGLMGIDASFFQNKDYIYLITCESKEFIKEVINKGEW